MRIVQSENKHLWYAVDDEDKICYVGATMEQVAKYISNRKG